jgi:O-antigen/teichoic acid export membrane protein
LRSIHLGTGSALTGAGYQRYRTWAQLFAALLNFGLNLKLIPEYSWLGAAWASLLTDGALSIINFLLFSGTLRREKLRLRQAEGVSC